MVEVKSAEKIAVKNMNDSHPVMPNPRFYRFH
jgi:hypothetical protein